MRRLLFPEAAPRFSQNSFHFLVVQLIIKQTGNDENVQAKDAFIHKK